MSEKTVLISALSPKGEGIAFYEGREIYVDQVLVGESIKVKIGEPFVKGSKRCPGELVEIVAPSNMRSESIACPNFGKCGGCSLQHLKYEGQLEYKRDLIKDAISEALGKYGAPYNLDDRSFLKEVVPCTTRPCRFKSIRYFSHNEQGELQLGFYAVRSHEVIAIDNCPIEPEAFSKIAQGVLNWAQAHNLKASKADDVSCSLKALQLRQGDESIMALLIVSGVLIPELKEDLAKLAANLGLASLYVGYHEGEGNALYCEQVELVYGEGHIVKTLLDHKFNVGPQTFLQVNYEVCSKLYEAAVTHCASNQVKALDDTQLEGVALDLCCGVGTMSLALAKHFKHVIGVEIVPSSIEAAKENAALNGVTNTHFIANDIAKAIPSLLKKEDRSKIRAIIADPARVGLGKENARIISKVEGPCQMSLIFCSLKAVKRDLPPLLKGGFTIDYIQGFDMFPDTNHIETLVCLSKRK